MAILPPDPIYLLRGDMGPVHSLLFRVSPYIEHLYAAAESGKIHIWDLRRNKVFSKFIVGKNPCLNLHIIGDERLITQEKGGTVNLWNPSKAIWVQEKSIDTGYCGFCRSQMLSEDILLVPLKESSIGAFSLKTCSIEYKLEPSQLTEGATNLGEVMTLKPIVLQDKELVLISYESGDIALWDISAKKVINWLKVESCPMAVEFDMSHMRGIVGSPTEKLQVFDLSKTHVLSLKTTLTLKNPGTSVITTRPDAKVFTAGGWDGRLRIFSWKTLRPLVVLDQHRATILDVVYSNSKVEAYDSKCVMAAAGKDGTVSLWNLYN
ncbi:guanine nucleotide-binding protein subunit beta-like protein 1 [Cephus cinctus]|uniref:Guanine nucleotide-binding protein subunit beta-like protein 1 n=1 Tax=Cephus cinctus TaxID=211228 RepID=A0AAJ7FQ73_CEPCN|nr:guanine nucleotide-binding protein subunit beta-like protein 1 [Cephus cinctus]